MGQKKPNKNVCDIPATHLWIYKCVRDRFGMRVVQTTEVISVIAFIVNHMPRRYHRVIFNEMCRYKLLKKTDRLKCEILKNNCEAKLKKLEDYFFY